MKKIMLKKIVAFAMAAVMVFASLAIPSAQAEAASEKSVKNVKLKIGSRTVTNKKYTMTDGSTKTLKVTVTPASAMKDVTFKSGRTKVATVSSKGKITAKMPGTAKITVTVTGKDNRKTKKYVTVTVKKATAVKNVKLKIGSVTVTNKKYTVSKGETKKLTVIVTPDSAKKSVAFKSNDKSVAEVDKKGKITAKAAGTAKVSVTVTGWNKKKTTKYVNIFVEEAEPEEPDIPGQPSAPDGSSDPKPSVPVKDSDGYRLKWRDEFDGTSLNRNDWNVEQHEPGWVNAELQKYVDSEENIYLKDGKLEIRPVQTKNDDGTCSYTSGRINTQGKHDFTYGIFEARVKVPEGQGYLPAFWMMPQNENLYGQWPRCGEIDIMEVMGQQTNKAYGTIHYGNPHNENQGTYILTEGSFSESYHTFAVEWLPGEIIWYVDGVETYRTSDWFSATAGQGKLTYPAPFDQPFHVILNLAVGGSWVGNPVDETFESQNYSVDFVRIYQKDSYDDSSVTAPEKAKVDVPTIGENLVRNGDFASAEDLDDEVDWHFATANNGEGSAAISNNEINITTDNAGTVDYSIQLWQAGIPMKKGAAYEVSFDAYADSARTMSSKISAPDNGWAVYGSLNSVSLATEKKSFTYTVNMTSDDDANGRLEFNMGNCGSTAGIHISNVSVKATNYEAPSEDDTKTVLADGNYVYNGAFQEGDKHRGYWEISEQPGASVSVTGLNDGRRLKVVAPAGISQENPVTVTQRSLALTAGEYAFSCDAEGPSGREMTICVAGHEISVPLTGAKQTVKEKFTLHDVARGVANKDLEFKITSAGTYYLDNIRLVEDSLIKNGNFNAGFAGYEPYIDGSADAAYVVDSQKEENAANFGITNTGDADWKIQLKQNHVELENGQWYRLTLDVKSTINRKFMYAIQRDGSKHNDDWTPYVQKTVDISNSWQTFSSEFQMKEPTDPESVLSLSMGAVGGTQITQRHDIYIDNIVLEKIEAPAIEEKPAGENLIKNAAFADGSIDGWTETIANWENGPGADAVRTINGNVIQYAISSVGTEDWNIQLKQSGIALEAGAAYTVTFKVKSSAARTIKSGVMSTSYDWYGGGDIKLAADTEQEVEFTFTMKGEDRNADFYVSMGKITDVDTPASTITLSDFSLVKQ